MPFLSTANFPAIRAALDVTLTIDQLPDDLIASAAYWPAAEAEVTRRLGALAATGAAAADPTPGQRAVILLTAARLVRALPSVTLRRHLDSELRYAREAPADRAKELRHEALAELAAFRATLDPTAPAVVSPATFTTAAAGRLLGAEGIIIGAEGTTSGL